MRVALADKISIGRQGTPRRNPIQERAHRVHAGAQKLAKSAGDWRQSLERLRTRREPGPSRTQKGTAMAAGAAGLAGAYFLDPDNGRRRRHLARDRASAFFRRRKEDELRGAGSQKGQAQGVVQEAVRSPKSEQPAPSDDSALAEKVRSETSDGVRS